MPHSSLHQAEPQKTVDQSAMAKYHVTLKASLPDGDLYWVADVTAVSEDAAMASAENLFTRQMDSAVEWSFSDADVELL